MGRHLGFYLWSYVRQADVETAFKVPGSRPPSRAKKVSSRVRGCFRDGGPHCYGILGVACTSSLRRTRFKLDLGRRSLEHRRRWSHWAGGHQHRRWIGHRSRRGTWQVLSLLAEVPANRISRPGLCGRQPFSSHHLRHLPLWLLQAVRDCIVVVLTLLLPAIAIAAITS